MAASSHQQPREPHEPPLAPPLLPPPPPPPPQQHGFLTTNSGVRVVNTDTSLKAGASGPTLLEDFHLREKVTHFDHESTPERVVHARGSGAHGYFQVYAPQAEATCAAFLNDAAERTPVFVRFSTVVGSRGSADTARDVRGFATRFYTREGLFDLVGNNIPVFFIQDAIKFPDLIHAVKMEADRGYPQAGSAHDTFWDFIGLTVEVRAVDFACERDTQRGCARTGCADDVNACHERGIAMSGRPSQDRWRAYPLTVVWRTRPRVRFRAEA